MAIALYLLAICILNQAIIDSIHNLVTGRFVTRCFLTQNQDFSHIVSL